MSYLSALNSLHPSDGNVGVTISTSPLNAPVTMVNNTSVPISNTTYLSDGVWFNNTVIQFAGDATTDVELLRITMVNEAGSINVVDLLVNITLSAGASYTFQFNEVANALNSSNNEFTATAICIFTGTAPTISARIFSTKLV